MVRFTAAALALAAFRGVFVAAYPYYSAGPHSGTYLSPLTDGFTAWGWTYYGCANELTGSHALTGDTISSPVMTVDSCMAFCRRLVWEYAGVEGQNCFCGSALASGSSTGQSGCDMKCYGNARETCGGTQRISVFKDNLYHHGKPPMKVNSFLYLGCFRNPSTSKTVGDHQLTVPTDTNGVSVNTVNWCSNSCWDAGYIYSALEYSTECWCGHSMNLAAVVANNPSSPPTCDQSCPGDSSQQCGGSDVQNVYQQVFI